MRIRHSDEMDYTVVSGHRTGDITFKRMMQGDPDALDNFELSLVRNRGAYYTPRHRHNFDQIRLVLEGEFSYADKKVMESGDAGFFPEGTYYGPQNVTDCITLVLQCGAPSSSGYLDYTTLGEGHRELTGLGSFDNGVFTRGPGANLPGTRRKQDGYEAIWEYKRGQEIAYPPARYSEPVIMKIDSFEWEPTAVEGIERRLLGTFINETRMVVYRLAPGARLDLARGVPARLRAVG